MATNKPPTPAPVTVPEGGWRDGDWFVTRGRRVAQIARGKWHDETGLQLDREWVERVFAERVVVYVHAPREDAPRPEPDDRRAEGEGDCTNVGCDGTYLHGGPCDDEPVVVPLPTEAVEVAAVEFRRHVWDESERNWHVNLRCVCGADPGLSAEAAGHWMLRHRLAAAFAAADQRARDEGTVREVVAQEIEKVAEAIEAERGMTTTEGEAWQYAARIARGGSR